MANEWQIKTPLARTASGGKFLKGFVKGHLLGQQSPKKHFFQAKTADCVRKSHFRHDSEAQKAKNRVQTKARKLKSRAKPRAKPSVKRKGSQKPKRTSQKLAKQSHAKFLERNLLASCQAYLWKGFQAKKILAKTNLL